MFTPMIDKDASDEKRYISIVYYAVAGIIYGANKSCICSLHMIASILICKRISGMFKLILCTKMFDALKIWIFFTQITKLTFEG